MRRALVAANWKMHGSVAQLQTYLRSLQVSQAVDVVLVPPAVYLPVAVTEASIGVACGVQDIGTQATGAHTGEVAAAMVRELGGSWAIVGHSERRLAQQETDELVALKASAALQGGLQPIVCVGETYAERKAGNEYDVVRRQLSAVLNEVSCGELSEAAIGYEPVWAIGTGETASPEQAQQMHGFIRAQLAQADVGAAQQIRIVYGGSVKPDNAAELFAQPDIDGGLVGGASMDADQFSAIIAAAARVED
jgi:triosephosphate isomerase